MFSQNSSKTHAHEKHLVPSVCPSMLLGTVNVSKLVIQNQKAIEYTELSMKEKGWAHHAVRAAGLQSSTYPKQLHTWEQETEVFISLPLLARQRNSKLGIWPL